MRAIVQSINIFELPISEAVPISFTDAEVTVSVSNGFHSSEPQQLTYAAGSTYFFHVTAVVSNSIILALLAAAIILFSLYAYAGFGLLLVAANLPVLVLIWMFFGQAKTAIVLKAWQPDTGL